MTHTQKVKQAMFNLNGLYYQGKIVYPRVDNSYFKSDFNFFAHPDLKDINEFTKPLSRDIYPVNRNTILLYLGHKHLVSASTIISVNQFIDTTFDENLKPLNINYVSETIDKFLNFCNEKKITINDYISSELSKYTPKYIYSIRLKPTLITKKSANEKEIAKNNKEYKTIKQSINKDFFNDEDKFITYEENFFLALEKFKLKRKLAKLKEKVC